MRRALPRCGWLVLIAAVELYSPLARPAPAPRAEHPRPAPELLCQPGRGLWERAKRPELDRYCRWVGTARAAVWSEPKRALELAERARRLVPQGLEAGLVIGLAQLAEHQPDEAWSSFESALDSAGTEPIDPVFRLGAARAALLSGRYPSAAEHYRLLALGIDRLSGAHERARALLEAAVAVSYARPDGLAEARAFVRQARSHFSPLLGIVSSGIEAVIGWRDVAAPSAAAPSAAVREAAAAGANFLLVATLREDDSFALQWIFERTPPAFGAPGEALPVLPHGERSAILGAVVRVFDPAQALLHDEELLRLGLRLPAHIEEAALRAGARGPQSDLED